MRLVNIDRDSSLIVRHVFSSISKISGNMLRSGCRVSFLNDPAVIIYGLVKPIEEVRVLVSNECVEEALDDIMRSFDVFRHRIIAERRLREQGVVAVSTTFYPLLVIELAKSLVDKEVLENTEMMKISGYEVSMPRIEYLIAKMLSLKIFPYNIYAYTLLFSWIDDLDHNILVKLIKSSGIDIDKFVENINDMMSYLGSFQPISRPQSIDRFKALLKST